MRQFCYATLFVLLSVSALIGEEPVESAVVLKLNVTITDPLAIEFGELPKITGEHAVVCPGTEELKFQLHNYLIHHDGKYWCMFSHGPVVEDVPTQFVSYATSDDGLKWTAAKPVMTAPEAPYAYIARGFWLRDGELLALVAHFRDKGAFGVNKELKLEAYVWDKTADAWKFKDVLYEDAINNFEPQSLKDGSWLITRRDARFNVYMLRGGVKALDDWESFPVMQRLQYKPMVPDEPLCLMLPDGRIHALFRDNGGSQKLFRSFSSDGGKSWTKPELTNFPNATSKIYSIRLKSGAWVLISNACVGGPPMIAGRRSLYVSLSEDGLTFTKMAQLVIPMTKATTFQYPHAIEHNEHLLIAFSQKKMQTEVLKVPLASVEALRK
ncbi:hypothetical protein ETAA8_17060 [Anatilimnocola aggregata]|uniref:Sialidase domain-containing protein n=1 Tax=Anatilimnocola aggregata TaxID=2528021 RepID=A0A517Y8S9_9BACT|nr:exo-alpha-sialidase [Anatilimnocola aggregata]QDU26626.1 hypothetical protein ETAA8_17060 [Anatilimnocola aggregata]